MTATKLTEKEMNELKSEVLRERIDYLCEELGDPGRYYPALRSKGVLTLDDCERVKSKVTSREKVSESVNPSGNRRSSCVAFGFWRTRLVGASGGHVWNASLCVCVCVRVSLFTAAVSPTPAYNTPVAVVGGGWRGDGEEW